VIAILTLAAVAACGLVTTLTVRRGLELARPEPAPAAESPLDDRNNFALDFQSPGRARLVSYDDFCACDENEELARAVIDKELPDASPQEREAWHAELKGHSPETIREILSLSRRHPSPIQPGLPFDLQLASADSTPPRLLTDEIPAIPS